MPSDLAEATANVLAGVGHDNKAYELDGDSFTQDEIVVALNEVTGQNIQVMHVDASAYTDMLEQTNLAEPMTWWILQYTRNERTRNVC